MLTADALSLDTESPLLSCSRVLVLPRADLCISELAVNSEHPPGILTLGELIKNAQP